MEQTIGTLRFGLNAKKIENRVQKNFINPENDETLRNLIHEYEKQISEMKNDKERQANDKKQLCSMIQQLKMQ